MKTQRFLTPTKTGEAEGNCAPKNVPARVGDTVFFRNWSLPWRSITSRCVSLSSYRAGIDCGEVHRNKVVSTLPQLFEQRYGAQMSLLRIANLNVNVALHKMYNDICCFDLNCHALKSEKIV